MSRREYTIRLICANEGCRETSFAVADTRREEDEIRSRYARNPYRCTRHMNPDKVLSPDNRELTSVAIAGPSKKYPELTQLYWDGDEFLTSGLTTGPGFKAFAGDFPAGTKLIVTARIELPEAAS